MAKVTDTIVLFPLESGTYAIIKNDPIKKGDKVLTFPLENGGRIAIKSPTVSEGDRVVAVPRKTGTVTLRYIAIVDGIPKGAKVLRKERKE
ncbi:MAG: hypothetical protein LUQ13_04820 [Methanomicrobiales archaeon]|nr:hypothetical protein [Methanomicrobiales archaeon]